MDAALALRIAIVVAAALLLGWLFLGYLRRDRGTTQHMLDAFLSVLGSPRVGRSPWGYEFVEGTFDGSPARVSLLPDALITRTLPTLWLEVRWARRHDAWLCVIVAANGMEYFADDVDEGNRLVSPAEWPEGVVVRGKRPGERRTGASLARSRPHGLHGPQDDHAQRDGDEGDHALRQGRRLPLQGDALGGLPRRLGEARTGGGDRPRRCATSSARCGQRRGGRVTNNGRRGSSSHREAPKGPLKKPRPVWFVTLMAFVLPGSGQVFNGAPARGVIMQFGMVFGAFITYQLTTPEISPIGRMAGGLLVYVFSIVDANGIAKLRVKAWERIEAGQPPRPRKGMTQRGCRRGPPPRCAQEGRRCPCAAQGPARRATAGGPGKPAGTQSGPDDPAEPEDEPGEPGAPEGATGTKPVASERPSG